MFSVVTRGSAVCAMFSLLVPTHESVIIDIVENIFPRFIFSVQYEAHRMTAQFLKRAWNDETKAGSPTRSACC